MDVSPSVRVGQAKQAYVLTDRLTTVVEAYSQCQFVRGVLHVASKNEGSFAIISHFATYPRHYGRQDKDSQPQY